MYLYVETTAQPRFWSNADSGTPLKIRLDEASRVELTDGSVWKTGTLQSKSLHRTISPIHNLELWKCRDTWGTGVSCHFVSNFMLIHTTSVANGEKFADEFDFLHSKNEGRNVRKCNVLSSLSTIKRKISLGNWKGSAVLFCLTYGIWEKENK